MFEASYFLSLAWNLKDLCRWTARPKVILFNPDPTIGIHSACVGLCLTPRSLDPTLQWPLLLPQSCLPSSLDQLRTQRAPGAVDLWPGPQSLPAHPEQPISLPHLITDCLSISGFSFTFSPPCHFVSPSTLPLFTALSLSLARHPWWKLFSSPRPALRLPHPAVVQSA